MRQEEFTPRILGFLCHWCCYAAADTAGVERYQYPANLRAIRVMCTGRVDPAFLMRGFIAGADGIFTGGWHLGECHYQVGNYDAMAVSGFVKKVLTEAGVKPERFSLQRASAAEAPRFVKLINDFTEQLKSLGPLGQSEGLSPEEMRTRLKKALALVSDLKCRIAFGNLTKALRREGSKVTPARIAELVNQKLGKTISAGLSEQRDLDYRIP